MTEFVPECKHAYLKKEDAIAKNGRGVRVEHATDEAIKEALDNLLTSSQLVVEEIEISFLTKWGLVGALIVQSYVRS